MRKEKILLSLLDDYIGLYKILNFCETASVREESKQKVLNLRAECAQSVAEFDSFIAKRNREDFAFQQFKEQLILGLNSFKQPILQESESELVLHFEERLRRLKDDIRRKELMLL